MATPFSLTASRRKGPFTAEGIMSRTPTDYTHGFLHGFATDGLKRHEPVIQPYSSITTRGGSMILVPKIGPHGLFVPLHTGLFLQIAESAQLTCRAHLVRIFGNLPSRKFDELNAFLKERQMYARISAALVAVALVMTGLASAQERFGTLRGTVLDQQGAAVPGVTVTITNAVTGESRDYVTDANGQYLAQDLNPGRYNVAFELSGFARVERNDISVALGRAFELDAQMRVGQLTETVQVTAEAAPLVDTRSTLISHNVTAEEIDRLPKGRSFQSIALAAPSVNSGEVEGGFQVNGASGAENSFTVDGIVTNSLINGQSRQNTVFEYLQEVQVKTSGISAEYGGALGGVVSAVTKSGGNVFRGEGHWYFEGSPLRANPVERLVLDPIGDRTSFYVQDEESPEYHNEFGGSVGGPIVRDRLFFYGSYSPRNERKTNLYNFSDARSYDIERNIWRQQAFGKLSYAMSRGSATWSALWTPTKATGTHQGYSGATPNSYVGAGSSLEGNLTRGYETNQVNTSGTFDFSLSNTSFLSLRGGIFHDRFSDTGIPLTTSYTYQTPTTPIDAQLPPALRGGLGTSNIVRAQ